MTTQTNTVRPYKANHTQFGGFVYLSDFNTDHRKKNSANGSTIAKRIASDCQFDRQCKRNQLSREKQLEGMNDVKRNDETKM